MTALKVTVMNNEEMAEIVEHAQVHELIDIGSALINFCKHPDDGFMIVVSGLSDKSALIRVS